MTDGENIELRPGDLGPHGEITEQALMGALADVFLIFNSKGVTEYVQGFGLQHRDGAWHLIICDDNTVTHRWRLDYQGTD